MPNGRVDFILESATCSTSKLETDSFGSRRSYVLSSSDQIYWVHVVRSVGGSKFRYFVPNFYDVGVYFGISINIGLPAPRYGHIDMSSQWVRLSQSVPNSCSVHLLWNPQIRP
jgi:hypothetical protein